METLYLKNLRQRIRSDGDYIKDKNISDENLNDWCRRGFEKVWYELCNQGTDVFLKVAELSLERDDNERWFANQPQDLWRISRMDIRKGGNLYLAMKNTSTLRRSYNSIVTFGINLAGDEVMIIEYFPFSPQLPEGITDRTDQGYTADKALQDELNKYPVPPFIDRAIIDYAILRCRAKQDEQLTDSDFLRGESFNDVLLWAKKRDNFNPQVPDRIDERASYYFYDYVGKKIYLTILPEDHSIFY